MSFLQTASYWEWLVTGLEGQQMGKVHTEKSERQKEEEEAGREDAISTRENGRADGSHAPQNGRAHEGYAEGYRGSTTRANGGNGMLNAEDRRVGAQKEQDLPDGEAGAKSKGAVIEGGDDKVRYFALEP